jgi:dihydromethanopterin reductase
MKMDVRLIAAVGRNGQLGLGGGLPWHDPVDLKWFREATWGDVVLMGRRTYNAVGHLPGRNTVRWGGKSSPFTVLQQIHRRFGKTIWIGGGQWTYLAFMPYVRIAVITRIDYDGPADAYMPALWGPLSNDLGYAPTSSLDATSGASPLSQEAPSPSPAEQQDTDSAVRRKRHIKKRRI